MLAIRINAEGDNDSYKRMRNNESLQPDAVLNRTLEPSFWRAGIADVSFHELRMPFTSRLLSRGAAIFDVHHLLGHASVKTTEKAYAAFVRNERFKQPIDLLDQPVMPNI